MHGLRQLGLEVAPTAKVGDLSPAVQTLVAVARALTDVGAGDTDYKVVILDEPTAALPSREVATLLGGLRGLAEAGHAVVLVTHRLDEVTRAADDATVLRDARRVASFRVGSVVATEVVTMITGTRERTTGVRSGPSGGSTLLRVDDLAAGRLEDVSFEVGVGEIVGIAGLLGAGRSTLLEALFGARRLHRGSVVLDGAPWTCARRRRPCARAWRSCPSSASGPSSPGSRWPRT